MVNLDESACLGRLGSRELGRVAFRNAGRLEVFPVNYAMSGAIIVFRTAPGTKLSVIPTTPVVFQVDSWDPETGVGWSVVVRGRAEELATEPGRVAEKLRWVHPAAPGGSYRWLAIKPDEITGREFRAPPPPRERA